jgi:hypothetical protein
MTIDIVSSSSRRHPASRIQHSTPNASFVHDVYSSVSLENGRRILRVTRVYGSADFTTWTDICFDDVIVELNVAVRQRPAGQGRWNTTAVPLWFPLLLLLDETHSCKAWYYHSLVDFWLLPRTTTITTTSTASSNSCPKSRDDL